MSTAVATLSYLDGASAEQLVRHGWPGEARGGTGDAVAAGPWPILAAWRLPAPVLWAALWRQGTAQEGTAALLAAAIRGDATGLVRACEAIEAQAPIHLPARRSHAERLRRLFVQAFHDERPVLLLLAEHIARMRGLDDLSEDEQQAAVTANELVYLPLLEMFGMWALRRELGDLGLIATRAGEAERIEAARSQTIAQHERSFASVRPVLCQELDGAGIVGRVDLHRSSPSSVYRRLAGGESMKEMARWMKVDILLASRADCYRLVECIHRHWTPMEGRTRIGGYFRDLIAAPRYNGFQALVTSVTYGPESGEGWLPIEFRLRTEAMEAINLGGLVADRYTADAAGTPAKAWWNDRPLRERVCARAANPLSDTVFVLSPRGEVYDDFPRGSTPIDYAYRVHSAVGDHCRSIFVNGAPGRFDQALENGDLVSLQIDPAFQGPYDDWYKIVRTSTAKIHLKRALRQRVPAPASPGRRLVERVLAAELRHYHLPPLPPEELEFRLLWTARQYGYQDPEDLCADVVDTAAPTRARRLTPDQIAGRIIHYLLAEHIVRQDGQDLGAPRERVRFAHCTGGHRPGQERCRAWPGTDIAGRLQNANTPHAVFTVYPTDCPLAPAPEDRVPLAWRLEAGRQASAQLLIRATDRPGLLGRVLAPIYSDALNVDHVRAQVDRQRQATIELTLSSPDQAAVQRLSQQLDQLRAAGVIDDARLTALSDIDRLLIQHHERVRNPYRLTPAADRSIFKGRERELAEVVATLRDGQPLVVIQGFHRMGKTSLLRMLEQHALSAASLSPAYINIQGLRDDSADSLWLAAAEALHTAMAQPARLPNRERTSLRALRQAPTWSAFLDWLEDLRPVAADRPPVLLVDEFSSVEERWSAPERSLLAGRLKHLVEHVGLSMVLCVQSTYVHAVQAQPETGGGIVPLLRAGHWLRLDVLDPDASAQLVREPLGNELRFDDEVVAWLCDQTGGHPLLLQHLLHQLVAAALLRSPRVVTAADLDLARAAATRDAAMLFLDMRRHLRPASWYVLTAVAIADEGQGASAGEVLSGLTHLGVAGHCPTPATTLGTLRDLGFVTVRDGRYSVRIPLLADWLRSERPEPGSGSL